MPNESNIFMACEFGELKYLFHSPESLSLDMISNDLMPLFDDFIAMAMHVYFDL